MKILKENYNNQIEFSLNLINISWKWNLRQLDLGMPVLNLKFDEKFRVKFKSP